MVAAELEADGEETLALTKLENAVALDAADRRLHGRPVQRVDPFPEAEKGLAMPGVDVECGRAPRECGRREREGYGKGQRAKVRDLFLSAAWW
jgi:hypothetical protein